MKSSNKSLHFFFALCISCIAVVAIYFHRITRPVPNVREGENSVTRASTVQPPSDQMRDDSISRTDIQLPEQAPLFRAPDPPPSREAMPPRVLFRYTGIDGNYGKLAIVKYNDRSNLQFVNDFSCEVVHYAAGRGICLTADRGVFTTYDARIFDSHFKTLFVFTIAGVPSRCRISPDGKVAAFTYFLNGGGHSYASLDFSTQTLLIDTHTGRTIADIEDFAIQKEGLPYKEKDFNFWGVTFTKDSQQFFCTLSSNRKHYLVKGDVATRTGVVVHEGVECPSLSPDGLHVAFKKRFTSNAFIGWQLTVLNLQTLQETLLPDKRSVDDQLEWLDSRHVLYSLSDNPGGASAVTNVWQTDIDGARPEILLTKAYSPAVIRAEQSPIPKVN